MLCLLFSEFKQLVPGGWTMRCMCSAGLQHRKKKFQKYLTFFFGHNFWQWWGNGICIYTIKTNRQRKNSTNHLRKYSFRVGTFMWSAFTAPSLNSSEILKLVNLMRTYSKIHNILPHPSFCGNSSDLFTHGPAEKKKILDNPAARLRVSYFEWLFVSSKRNWQSRR